MGQSLTISNLAYVIFRHQKIFAGVVLLFFCVAVFYCVIASPKYEGHVGLVVNFSHLNSGTPTDQPQNAASSITPEDREEIINSYVIQLGGAELADDVIREIGLSRIYPKYAKTSAISAWVDGLSGVSAADLPRLKMERAIRRFSRRDLKIKLPHDSNIIEVSYFNPDREVAMQASKLLVDRFLEQESTISRNPGVDFVNGQVAFYKKQVLSAQNALQKFRETNHVTSLSDEQSALIQERANLEQTLAATRARAAEDRQKVIKLGAQLARLPRNSAVKTGMLDPLYGSAGASLGGLLAEEDKLRQMYKPDSAAIHDIHAKIDSLEKTLATKDTQVTGSTPNVVYQQIQLDLLQSGADLAAAEESDVTQSAQIAALSERLQIPNRLQGEEENLEREYQLADQNYRLYLQGVQQARIADDLAKHKLTSVGVYDTARVTIQPATPIVPLVIFGSILGGLLVGLGAVLLREELDERLNLPRQVEAKVGLPVFGTMGALSSAKGAASL